MATLIAVFVMLTALLLISPARAHYVWLERDGDGPARAYLGEWIDNIREKTGGLLDRIKAPQVFLGTSTNPLPVQRKENNLEIEVSGHGDVRLVESGMPPREDKEKGGVTKTIYDGKAGGRRPPPGSTWSWYPPRRMAMPSFSCFSVSHCPKAKSPSSPAQVAEAFDHR